METNDRNQSRDRTHEPQSYLDDKAVKQAAIRLAMEIGTRIEGSQNGVATFFDSAVTEVLRELKRLDKAVPWQESIMHLRESRGEWLKLEFQRLQLYLRRREQGRFVEFRERLRSTPQGLQSHCDIGKTDFIMSQGTANCMHWRGLPLFKSVYDVSLYTMMLWNIKPKTILELGSGTGGSAVWLADLMRSFGINGIVYSVDIKKPELHHKGVQFIQKDCRSIKEVFTDKFLRGASHPWLLTEDMHVNVYGVLNHFHSYYAQGDYIVIEDSGGKRNDIERFLIKHPNCYKVDTFYTDFFGQNATCAQDSILVRM